MRLDVFIRNHSTSPSTPATEQRYRSLLSPNFSQGARQNFWKSTELGMWHGRVGSYPAVIGDTERYKIWCENIKPFATFTDDLEIEYDRRKTPGRLLQRLGISFVDGQYWIELVYQARSAAYFSEGNPILRLAIPTHLESAGNWAFIPDRDALDISNHARDLATGSQGLKEIIHQRVDATALVDAIVWQEPTKCDWTHPNSPYV